MNTKIFTLLVKNIKNSFNLSEHENISDSINKNTIVQNLPWTPDEYNKFKNVMKNELQLDSDYIGTIEDITLDLSNRYNDRFFREIWVSHMESYDYSGYQLIDEINNLNPEYVLDVGCGYNQFKGKIQNLIGIDPYNSKADYEIDILEYQPPAESFDVILALGSINFNSRDEIESRFSHCVNLLKPGGKFFLRANPGIPHKTGPYVDIFPWSHEIANEFATSYNLNLDLFKQDKLNRVYLVYTKL